MTNKVLFDLEGKIREKIAQNNEAKEENPRFSNGKGLELQTQPLSIKGVFMDEAMYLKHRRMNG